MAVAQREHDPRHDRIADEDGGGGEPAVPAGGAEDEPVVNEDAQRHEGEAHETQGGDVDDVEAQDPCRLAPLGEHRVDVESEGVRRERRQLAVTVAAVMGRARKGSSRISMVSPAARNAISAADTKALE